MIRRLRGETVSFAGIGDDGHVWWRRSSCAWLVHRCRNVNDDVLTFADIVARGVMHCLPLRAAWLDRIATVSAAAKNDERKR